MNRVLSPLPVRMLAASGALLAAAAVALSAYAAHASEGVAQANLQLAALFGFGHGLALAALARSTASRFALIALALLLVGTVLFSGALVAKSLFGMASTLAPLGGSTLIIGWLLYAVASLRG